MNPDSRVADSLRVARSSALAGGDVSRWPEKLPVRQRIGLLLDPGSWVEDGLLADAAGSRLPADGVLTGVGTVEGRPVAVVAHDFSVKAGSWGELSCEKQIRILERADRDLLPVFYLVDSAGGRLTDQMGFFPGRRGASRIFQLQVALSGRVPQICCLHGPSAAGGAYMPAFTDWVGMVEGNASMYLASPRIAEKVTGEKTTLEEMGGAVMHATVSGCADEVFGSDWEVIAAARHLLTYLPDDWRTTPPRTEAVDPEFNTWPTDLIPEDANVSYDVRDVIDRFVDARSFYEIKSVWATEIVTGLARIEGQVLGIVANQPSVRSGAIFVDTADKAARFVSLCDAFNIPLLFLHDVPGFMVGAAVERQGIIRHGAKMIAAMASAEVPKFSVILRKTYAAGFYAMCAPGFEPRATIALPTASIGTMSPDASVNAIYANKISAIENPDERAAFVAARVEEQAEEFTLLRMASELVVDATVEPQELRGEACRPVACGPALDSLQRATPPLGEPGLMSIPSSTTLVARSMLFVPGNKPSMIAKIPSVRPDLAVVDLEDAVAPAHKDAARHSAVAALADLGSSRVQVLVRVNPPGTAWYTDDLAALADLDGIGIVLPKYQDRTEAEDLRERLPSDAPLVVGLESARGIADCRDLLDGPVDAAYFGAEDYIADVGGRRTSSGIEVLHARSEVVLAARLCGVPAVDQAVLTIRDPKPFRDDAMSGAALGYAGKICLHPAQVATAHEVFTPSEEEIMRARAVRDAAESGLGMIDGAMVDSVHLRVASEVLARAKQHGEHDQLAGSSTRLTAARKTRP
ncbi:MAG: aldolase/citrate lyase family protein [Nocardioides sp.]|uniref:aldolase/citrate lyase family protein n=1 Tax=Nocardioides sp. TaxID=35761 RepID=UPI0039E588A5